MENWHGAAVSGQMLSLVLALALFIAMVVALATLVPTAALVVEEEHLAQSAGQALSPQLASALRDVGLGSNGRTTDVVKTGDIRGYLPFAESRRRMCRKLRLAPRARPPEPGGQHLAAHLTLR